MIKLALKHFCLFLLFVSNAWAANDPRWYEVELILFENLDKSQLQTESWPSGVGQPDYSNTTNRLGIKTLNAQAYPLRPHSVIPGSKRRLLAQYTSLKSSSQYRPLFYRAWYQNMQRNKGTASMYIEVPDVLSTTTPSLLSVGAALPELEGTLRITIGRFLHVYSDLIFRQNGQIPIVGTSFDTAPSTTPLGYTTELQSYQINTHRSMRSKKIHYIDHPAIGMIVLFTPYKTRITPAEVEEVPNPLANLKKKAQSTEEKSTETTTPMTTEETPTTDDN